MVYFLRDNKIMIKSNNKGFTYIELVLAMAIIVFIVLAFSQLFLRTTISVKSMEFQTLAYNLAGDKMEELRNRSFGSIVCVTELQNLSGKIFTRNVTVSQLENSLKRVDIEVTWTEGGEIKSIGISSLIVDKG